jgi:hypothetical protein
MAIEAPYSRHNKTNFKIVIYGCFIGALVLGYDGYVSKYQWSLRRSFYKKHISAEGLPDGTIKFNQQAAPVLLGIAIIAAIWYFSVRNLKVVADENELIISKNEKIPYGSIIQVDKTHFDSRGFFVITYKTADGKQALLALTYKKYDNLKAILDHLVAKIT